MFFGIRSAAVLPKLQEYIRSVSAINRSRRSAMLTHMHKRISSCMKIHAGYRRLQVLPFSFFRKGKLALGSDYAQFWNECVGGARRKKKCVKSANRD